jgi:hypothetical protein
MKKISILPLFAALALGACSEATGPDRNDALLDLANSQDRGHQRVDDAGELVPLNLSSNPFRSPRKRDFVAVRRSLNAEC